MPLAERRAATWILQAGAIAVVLAAAPYKTFELDRFFVPKEVLLNVTAGIATLLCVARARHRHYPPKFRTRTGHGPQKGQRG